MNRRRRNILRIALSVPALTTGLLTFSGLSRRIDKDLRKSGRLPRIAQLYAHRFPEEDNTAFLNLNVPKSANALAEAISKDFSNYAVVTIDGWLLSRTECRYMLKRARMLG